VLVPLAVQGNVVLPPDNTSPDEDLDEDALAL
jgi:hypothetical protein